MWQLVSGAAGLLHWWWQRDRIRASPREGRLLRLEPPCFVRIAGEFAQVLRRQVVRGPDEPRVVYSCRTAATTYELVVQLGRARVVVRDDDGERIVAADEVEVIPGEPGLACSRPFNF